MGTHTAEIRVSPGAQAASELAGEGLILTIQGLHGQLQAQVVPWVDHPVVAGGRDVEHQPALLGGPEGTAVKQEQV